MGILDQFFVYHPDPWKDQDWKARSGLPLEEVWFQSGDGTKLFGWYVESAATSAVVLWCHGNAGNIINRLENLRELYGSDCLSSFSTIVGMGAAKGLLLRRGCIRMRWGRTIT